MTTEWHTTHLLKYNLWVKVNMLPMPCIYTQIPLNLREHPSSNHLLQSCTPLLNPPIQVPYNTSVQLICGLALNQYITKEQNFIPGYYKGL